MASTAAPGPPGPGPDFLRTLQSIPETMVLEFKLVNLN